MMSKLTVILALPAAVLLGSLVGAAFVLWLDDPRDPRDRSVTVDLNLEYDGVWSEDEGSPLCAYSLRFCIVELEDESLAVVYTINTFQPARDHLCSVWWDGEATFELGGDQYLGLFISSCNGTRWDETGNRIFGPGPRDLDRFPFSRDGDVLTIDLGKLICGDSDSRESADGKCSLAPPYN